MKRIVLSTDMSTVVSIAVVGVLLTGAMAAIYLAPTEQTMGDAQRVMYMHVAVAWFALLGFIAMAGFGLRFLINRDLRWDDWSHAIGEVGWICATLTLITGSMWAHEAWGTWWTWDPRLISSFILWAFYSGNLIIRSGLEDQYQRARLSALLVIIGAADVPLVVMATRWFRGMHPVTPELEPSMRYALWACVIAMTAVMSLLVIRRRSQLRIERRAAELQTQMDMMQTGLSEEFLGMASR